MEGLVIGILIVLVIIIIIWMVVLRDRKVIAKITNEIKVLDKKLQEAGWTVYLRQGCPWCTKQMQVYELNDFKHVVHYDQEGKLLKSYTPNPPLKFAEIQGYPLWYNTKTGYKSPGYKDVNALKDMLEMKR